VALRVIASNGTDEVYDFNDRASGVTTETIQEPSPATKKIRTDSPLVDGDVTVAWAMAAGDLVAVVRFEGATWGACQAEYQSAEAALFAEGTYYLETVIEGVTKRWRAEVPDEIAPGPLESVNLYRKRQTYSIRWHVQPNPSVTVA
jgi:hypothetical protein